MNLVNVIGVSLYLVGAVLLALSLVFAMGLALQTEGRYGKYLLPGVLPIIGFGVAVSTILGGRNLALANFDPSGMSIDMQTGGEGTPLAATWPLRLATLYILAASFALILAYLFRRNTKPQSGRVLMLTFAFFFLSNVVAPAILGTKPNFVLNHYYPLVVFLAAFATRTHDPDRLLLFCKGTLLVFLTVSLVMALIQPALVLQRPYLQGWIPGLKYRLWGLASHANSLGPLALLYLSLVIHQPFRSRWLQWSGLGIGLAVLLMAQSKTAWVSFVLVLAILGYYRATLQFKLAWSTGRTSYLGIGIAAGFVAAALGLLVVVFTGDIGPSWDRFAHSTTGGQLFSLTGRSAIWDVAVNVWSQNPLFGYGPSLWDPEFRRSIGMNFAFSAHNQFMQSLASAGLFGVLGLLVYLGTTLHYAIVLAPPTRGFSLALGAFLLMRCMTETPLTTGTPFNGDVLAHLLIFSYLIREKVAVAHA